jgi:hypothetical protein
MYENIKKGLECEFYVRLWEITHLTNIIIAKRQLIEATTPAAGNCQNISIGH